MRTESDGEKDTQDEWPQPTLFTIRLFEPFADSVVVLMVMMSAEEQHDAAYQHESCQNGFAPVRKKMLNAIRKHEPLKDLEKLFDFDGLYHRIRRLTNGNTHYNKLYYLWLNNNMIYNPNRVKELNNLYSCILHLFILHFAYMYSLNPHYMMSSDYVDALDCNMEPEEDSQYWVATYVTEVFEKYIVTKRPDIADYMRNHSEMKLWDKGNKNEEPSLKKVK